jgi:hypothetical protein
MLVTVPPAREAPLHRLFPLALTALLGCEASAPLDAVDADYAEVLARLHAADRDVARNIHNRDARRRKKIAEKERVAFFRDPDVIAAIEQARQSPVGSIERTKGEAYHRHAVFVRSWKDEEKERETELLARLDALAGAEASWSPPEGDLAIPLSGSWSTVSMQADALPAEQRADLAHEYVSHHMAMVGDDLRELVKLRNSVARREGFDSFWHLSLYNQGLTEADVDAIITELEPVVRPVNQAYGALIAQQAESLGVEVGFAHDPYLRRQTGLEAGRDEADPYFDTDLAEDRVLASLRRMGMELEGPPATPDGALTASPSARPVPSPWWSARTGATTPGSTRPSCTRRPTPCAGPAWSPRPWPARCSGIPPTPIPKASPSSSSGS